MTPLRRRAMVIEDDHSGRDVIRRQLESLGWDVVAFATGEEGVRSIANGLEVDLLLADVQLPGMNGIASARAVAMLAPGVRLVFMSGAPPPVDVAAIGAPFLHKPFSVSALADALGRAMSA